MKAEMELIFGRVPLVLGFSSEPKNLVIMCMEVCGVPLILVRIEKEASGLLICVAIESTNFRW